jgi:AcrR family transcriptional regulator
MNEQAAVRKRAPRRDAQLRREVLLYAATSCFQEYGYDVPLEVVAERAGVGRGTLYRNFSDREALALAIFSREIDRFEDSFDPEMPLESNLGKLVREGASAHRLYQRIATDPKRSDANLAAFKALGQRLEQLLARLVRQACERGEIDTNVSPADLVLVLRMVGGLLLSFHSEEQIDRQISAALRLLVRGLRPR